MSARGILTIAGTAVGSYFGGPVGGAIGGMIGGAVGGAIDGPVHSSQQILEDLGALKLDYGSTWPRIYGRYRFKISPLWSSEKRPIAHDEEVDSKGGPSAVNTSYTYEQDWLCWAPLNAAGWARIWRNGELIATRLVDSDPESIAATVDTSAWASVTFFDGADDQMPWSVYEAAVGTENASAYRHRPTLAFESLDLGNSGQAPLIEVEFFTEGGAGDALTVLQTYFDDNDSADISGYDNGPGAGDTDAITGGAFSQNSETYEGGEELVLSWDVPSLAAHGEPVVVEGYITVTSAYGWAFQRVVQYAPDAVSGSLYQIGINGDGDFAYNRTGIGGTGVSLGVAATGRVHVAMQFTVSEVRVYINEVLRYTDSAPSLGTGGTPSGKLWLYLNSYGSIGGFPANNLSVDEFAVRRYEKFTGSSITVGEHIDPPDGDTVDPQAVDLADIVSAEALLEWTGETGALTAADIDVSELEGTLVTGVAFTGSPREAIAALMDVYYFQAVCSDKLYFRFRGAASSATIPFKDTGIGVGEAAVPFCGLERGNDIEVALQVAFTCPGLLRDYEPDTQHSDRLIGESFELRRYQSPVVFEPAEAKGRADTMVYDARVAAHAGKLALGDDYLANEPTDVVTAFDQEGNSYRLRIERETYADSSRVLDVVLDDPNVLLSSGITAETDQRAITIAPPASTELILLDTRLLRDADDVPGHLIAMRGTGRWPGGVAYRATTEAGTYERITSVTTSAIAGITTTALPDFTGGNVFDESSVVRVQVSGGTLTSSTRDAVLADGSVNAFAIGAHGRWEIVQAVNASLVSSGVYDLSGLLRGRLGTEQAIGTHQAGDTVIKLQPSGLRSVEQQASEIGATRYWKGVTVGGTLNDAEAQEFAAESDRLKPDAPVDLRCSRDGTGGFAITASRRSRYAATLFSTVPLGEDSEAYEVDILDGDDVVRTIAATSFPVQYTATQQVADFGAVQSSIDVAVYQMSATVGRGYPLTGTLSTSYTPVGQVNTITLGGTFASGVPISVYANGVLIASRTSVGGDTNLDGIATGLAAVIDATSGYAASAVGSVITVTGTLGATYTLTAIVGGSSAISIAKTQEAALASPGRAYEGQLWVSNLSTGVTEPIPSGVTFTVTVKESGFTVSSFSYTTTASTSKVGLLTQLSGALDDNATLSAAGYLMSLDSTDSGGYFGVLLGPVGTEEVSLQTTASAPWGLAVVVQDPGSGPVAENQPQIVDVTVTGTPANGEVFRVTLDGTPFTYTATVPTDTREEVIDGLVAAIDADADLTASQVSSTKLQASATFIGDFSYSAGITRAITATVA